VYNAALTDNGGQVCSIVNQQDGCPLGFPGVTADLITLNCIGGYSAWLDFHGNTVYYATPYIAPGSFGTVQSGGDGGNTYLTANVWGC
jgi:hypothetical protein